MDAPTPNIPLLRKAVEWAEAEAAKPDAEDCMWDQREWVADLGDCGTAYCIAGYAVFLTIGPVVEEAGEVVIGSRWRSFFHVAVETLGLTEREGYDLFDADNSIGRVRAVAEGIAARAGERL